MSDPPGFRSAGTAATSASTDVLPSSEKLHTATSTATLEAAVCDRFEGRHPEVACACPPSLLDQLRHGVHPDHRDPRGRERPSKPALAAAEVEHGFRLAAQDCIEDRLVGGQLTTANRTGSDPQPSTALRSCARIR